MRISDWSSDVCSSDLSLRQLRPVHRRRPRRGISRPDPAPSGRAVDGGPVQAAAADELPLSSAARLYAARRHSLWRSEEHTSELQSLMRTSYAVFCWKKKTSDQYKTRTTNTSQARANSIPTRD